MNVFIFEYITKQLKNYVEIENSHKFDFFRLKTIKIFILKLNEIKAVCF
jgi:hypothetical protein